MYIKLKGGNQILDAAIAPFSTVYKLRSTVYNLYNIQVHFWLIIAT